VPRRNAQWRRRNRLARPRRHKIDRVGEVVEWQLLSSELAFDHRWYRVRRDTVRLPDGRIIDDYFVGDLPDIALVVAITVRQEVVFVRQWKQGVREVMLELPGGLCDSGEDPVVTAARELAEETGYVCDSLACLGSFEVDPSKNSNVVHIFLGTSATHGKQSSLDENEQIELQLVPVGDVRGAIGSRRLTALGTVAGLTLALAALTSPSQTSGD
jgi:ADP-ribose pyrophosphatase